MARYLSSTYLGRSPGSSQSRCYTKVLQNSLTTHIEPSLNNLKASCEIYKSDIYRSAYMVPLHEDIFASCDHDPEPESGPFEETFDFFCTPVKLGRRCFRCRLKLASGEETKESTKSALELVVTSQGAQGAQRNNESDDNILEPIPNPTNAKMKRYGHKKLHRMEKFRAPSHGPVSSLNYEIAHRLPPRIEPRAFILIPTRHTFTMVQ
ncbi:uncharacterized protein FFB20_13545 [Fusarium fujikuroi]|nr:uncharacterized protein FFC1_06051 [Fusarium fujikuroi]SCN97044.1 uncharacterized protein FFM5_06566 [Fusarium fujikuroi]SCO00891.1 uncharacterized protein FFE2_09613 [Fusarium fujikuroi]SCO10463.1 uncharacterized protein FFB20_13545 [Fusarium fujikuroi]SCO38312.1 uncharacterized protein FFNC_06161 [Fusarium fujikuroi]